MRVLLIYPIFPPSFWSFDKTIELLGRKAFIPPLGLITVAAILPQEWEFRLVDRNVRDITPAEWAWADLVMFSAMIVQKDDLLAQIRKAKSLGKTVVVGGPYPTALPNDCREAGADFLVLDEGEITIPPFLEALRRGATSGTFRANGVKPDITHTPIPRFDLLQLDAYSEMSVQFSRGCPFLCEFCDIIVLYGRKPRTKTPPQMLAELDRLSELGWRRSVFVVDDNFIGNKKNVKAFLQELRGWMVAHRYPFTLSTEASIDLAQDQQLLEDMVTCNFGAVFLGVETPDPQSLELTKKSQNNRDPLDQAIQRISRSGLRIMAGFIIGFDNEKPGAGDRIVEFVERTAIPTASFSMLQALPDTALSQRLAREGRLLDPAGNLNQTSLINFIPTRPIEEIAREYVDGFWELYDPIKFLKRVFRHYMLLRHGKFPQKPRSQTRRLGWTNIKALATVIWRQGAVRTTRTLFWRCLYRMYRDNRGGIGSFISTCAQAEHLIHYRQLVRAKIQEQIRLHRQTRVLPAPQVAPGIPHTPAQPPQIVGDDAPGNSQCGPLPEISVDLFVSAQQHRQADGCVTQPVPQIP